MSLLFFPCRQGGGEQQEEEEKSLEHLAMVASSAESNQILRLAEVEHILGAACLQLGLAAAAGITAQKTTEIVDSSPRQPAADTAVGIALPGAPREVVASKATVAEAAEVAAGGRRAWGFGAGPFAEVFATKSAIFSGGEDSRGESGGGDVGDVDEDAIVAQLEVRNVSGKCKTQCYFWSGFR